MSQSVYVDEDVAVISKSGLFDVSWYLEHSQDVGAANVDPIRHYVLHGEKEGRHPSRELRLEHFLGDLTAESIGGRSPLAYYIINHKPCYQIEIISRSGLFDKAWYIEKNPDVQDFEIDPIKHYVFYGAKEGRLPNAEIRLDQYIREVKPEVIGTTNPLVHYILSGRKESKVAIIAKSGLFDTQWYLKNNSDVNNSDIDPIEHYVLYGEREGRLPNRHLNLKQYIINVTTEVIKGQSPLVHYILYGKPEQLIDPGKLRALSLATLKLAIDRLRRLPIYNATDYVELNGDIKNSVDHYKIDPAAHALAYGVPEGRHIFKTIRVAQVLGECARRPFPVEPEFNDVPALPPIGVFYNSSGNVFIKELAAELVDALQFIGLDAELVDEKTKPKINFAVTIIVAPHEFFHIGAGKRWVNDEILRNAFMYNTEQPQTIWFERAIPFILASRGVIDICLQISDIFEQSGIPAVHFNPNARPAKEWLLPEDMVHPFYKILPKKAKPIPDTSAPFATRPIDICFFGTASRSRELFFSKNAKFLSDYQAFIYYRKFAGPLIASGRDGILSRIGRHVTAHSKIALNIHRDELGFFEWHRLVKQGMVGGSIVVTEPCLPHPVFKPGIHFLEESTRHIPDLIEWLLKSKDGEAKARLIQKNISTITDEKYSRQNSIVLANFLKTNGA
jgi:hypothetical protein